MKGLPNSCGSHRAQQISPGLGISTISYGTEEEGLRAEWRYGNADQATRLSLTKSAKDFGSSTLTLSPQV